MNKRHDDQKDESLLLKAIEKLLERNSLNRRLHWTTIASEKALLAVIGILTLVACVQSIAEMYSRWYVGLPDLFFLFIYAEIIGDDRCFLFHKSNSSNFTDYYCRDGTMPPYCYAGQRNRGHGFTCGSRRGPGFECCCIYYESQR